MNRWILEPLFSVVYILLLATVFLAVALAGAELDFAVVVVTMIVLWAAVVVVWSRRSAAKDPR